jgi:hypothetical protein
MERRMGMKKLYTEYADEVRIFMVIICCCVIALACGEPYRSESKIWTSQKILTKSTIAISDVDIQHAKGLFTMKVANEAFADALTHYFSVAGWSVIERSQMARILQEANLQQSGLIDKNKTAQIGKLTGAKFLVLVKGLGDFHEGSYILYSVTIKVIDVESGETVLTLRNDRVRKELMAAANDIGGEIEDTFAGEKKTKKQ